MYDILQLNDMLLPELLDIAEQLKIAGVKKLDKQGLIYKILDSQALTAKQKKTARKNLAGPANPLLLKPASLPKKRK
jgi:transcription termination factor Rho